MTKILDKSEANRSAFIQTLVDVGWPREKAERKWDDLELTEQNTEEI